MRRLTNFSILPSVLVIYSLSDTCLGSGHTAINKTGKTPALGELTFLLKREGSPSLSPKATNKPCLLLPYKRHALFSVLNLSFNGYLWHSAQGCPDGSVVKNLPGMQEAQFWFLGWEDPLKKKMASHVNILAWRIPWTEGPGGLPSMWSQNSQTRLNNWTTKSNNPVPGRVESKSSISCDMVLVTGDTGLIVRKKISKELRVKLWPWL